MKKSLSYRLLKFGAVPKNLLPELKQEGIIIFDEGMPGRFIAKRVDGKQKRYRKRSEGFSGSLVITHKRVVFHTYRKRQINLSVKDPKLKLLYVELISKDKLAISFQSADFHPQWQGIMQFQFSTDKANQFRDVLASLGAQKGSLPTP